jgi:hypothetical protein
LTIVGARIYLLGIFGHSLLKRKKITEKIEIKIQYLETYALIDVLWSSIPLGILTAYEMIYFSKFGGVQNSLELFKMIALAIDIIGIVFLVLLELSTSYTLRYWVWKTRFVDKMSMRILTVFKRKILFYLNRI